MGRGYSPSRERMPAHLFGQKGEWVYSEGGGKREVGRADEILVGVKPVVGTGRRAPQQEPGAVLLNSRHGNGPGGHLLFGASDRTPIGLTLPRHEVDLG